MPHQDKYTDPELREQVKEEIKQGDKGGQPGQWSARKAQMMAAEYKRRGGDYTTDKETGQDESQKNLSKWTEEEWQTKDGEGEARQEDGSRKRYLPKKAWEQMGEEEKEQTDQKKQEASKNGNQFVSNTEKAKDSRKKASEEAEKELEDKNDASPKKRSNGGHDREELGDDKDDAREDDEYAESQEEEEDEEDGTVSSDIEMDIDGNEQESKQKAGRKRGRKTNKEEDDANKSRKANGGQGKDTHGSKHDSMAEPAQQGSADRLPEVGDRISWKAMPGWVHGKLVEIVTTKKNVKGKDVKGSENDPRFVLEADSGKICVHKPETCYYD